LVNKGKQGLFAAWKRSRGNAAVTEHL
jgi:hypothetical protein